MMDLDLFAPLIGDKNGAASLLSEMNPTAGHLLEVTCLQLAAVDECYGQSVCQHWAELLHQVKCQGGSAGSQSMKVADLRIQPDPFQR